jgi:DNA-binding HxlR family transcriptional regulator
LRIEALSRRHPVTPLLGLLGRRWALRVLWELRIGPLPFGALRERCDEVSTSTLAARLRELEARGITERTASGWALTPAGEELGRLLLGLSDWARRHDAG